MVFPLAPVLAKYGAMIFTAGEQYGWHRVYRRSLEIIKSTQSTLTNEQQKTLKNAIATTLRAPTIGMKELEKNQVILDKLLESIPIKDQVLKTSENIPPSFLRTVAGIVGNNTTAGKFLNIFLKIVNNVEKNKK